MGNTILKRYLESKHLGDANPGAGSAAADRFAAAIYDTVADENQRRLISELTSTEEFWTIEGCRRQIRHFAETGRSRSSAKDISRKIKEAERNKDDRLLKKLLEEKQQLAVQRDRNRTALVDKL